MSKKLQQQIFLIVFAIIAIALISPVNYTTTGLDAGWTEAILMVTERVRTFGQDFIFTYGPLGYLQ
jgi:ABC-type multidrug transport system permease subunit